MFIAEDGTGLSEANSAVTVEFADSYFSVRNIEKWLDLDLTEKQVALVKGTDYAETKYGTKLSKFKRLRNEQSLQFPKVGFMFQGSLLTGTPVTWKKAVCEYALISISQELFADIQTQDREINSKEVTVGPITTKTSYSDNASNNFRNYPSADRLADLVVASNFSGRVLR
jgi:hypothetical protein